ncbi:helix-turn-helix transcriptional regulator [Cupriavidus sp. CV2]|uniref:helix-turn-helix domain-containing protein n=1 Tax=Cupriavidus ulmosensis TaxID=3065913 RepID=UPI00296B1BD3|nr:helix-turn-helix transcriptional regulator [Cupriavidus sp. CV2]MDW3686612.1 helix-turn-helix transcriptional regulator [Cupriavidus sp. CV2]
MKRDNSLFASPDLTAKSAALGEAIAAARIARNLSRKDFAERANISPSTLVRIERGDISVNFLAWMQAFERAGLLALLQPVADLRNDALGEARRKAESRVRPRKPAANKHDF